MKKFTVILMLFATLFAFNSCKSSSSSASAFSSSTSAASGLSSGQSCGSALKNLYTQYKADGKLDMTNTSNLLQLASLANSCKQIKDATKDSQYYKSFAQGVIAGSTQTVTTSTVDNVISTVSNLNFSDLLSGAASTASTISNAASTASSVSNTVSTLSSLLGSF